MKSWRNLVAATASVALVFVGLVATSAAAETTAAYINRTISSDIQRTIDPSTHNVTYYAGENFNLGFTASIKSSVLSSRVNANSVITVEGAYSVVSGTVPTSIGKSISISGTISGSSFSEYLPQNASDFRLTKTLSAAPTNTSLNAFVGGIASTDIVFHFDPVVKIDDYTLVSSDFNESSVTASSYSGGPWGRTNGKARLARTGDRNLVFYSENACLDTSGLTSGDILTSTITASDGTSNVGTDGPRWSVKNAQGMPVGSMVNASTYTFTGLTAGDKLFVNNDVTITNPEAGKTYTFGEYKVVKQGTTTNLISACNTSGATFSASASAATVTVAIDFTSDIVMMMSIYDTYVCNLYATSDSSHSTVIATSAAMAMTGPGSTTSSCNIRSVPNGTYSVGVRGSGWKGISDEIFNNITVTVSGGSSPSQKTAPTAPSLASKVKKGKTISLKLHATAGTKKVAKNANGLVTTVALASGAKKYCSLTKVLSKKKKTITGFTVKGLKVHASKCQVVVTITGDATYDSLTRTYTVKVTK